MGPSILDGYANMKVILARDYWRGLLRLSAKLDVSDAIIWLRRSKWPLEINETGLTLRNRRRISWRSIRKIGVSRSYLDGHISQIRIHYKGEISRVPIEAIQDGDKIARVILAMFAALERARDRARHSASEHQSSPSSAARGARNVRDPSVLRGSRAEQQQYALERRI
jgi:hypothetical protein